MATFADLEAQAQRAEEDVTAIINAVIETRDDVKWLKQAVVALLDHHGITVPDSPTDEG